MHDLRLALFLGSSADIITLAEFLALDPADRAQADVSPDWACVSLLVDGVEQWGSRLSFGALGALVEQLLPAAARLKDSQRAVIGAPAADSPICEYIIFDPNNGDVTAVIAAFDTSESWDWPIQNLPDENLYALIDANLDAMIEVGFRLRELQPMRVNRTAIAEALVREAAIGTQALKVLGSDIF